ncbi:MAG: LacI family DNA-binding transcriptional regulator [Tissierellales bacterium]|nr:LacI family DNA-binding transcriptional regulator [Tissierellales bacterium]
MQSIKRTTIKDVAKMANVSPSTVSRVISNSPRISEETAKRVKLCMKELGYYPNAIARSLASSVSNTIGLIMPVRPGETLLNPFFQEALRGIVRGATTFSYDVLLSTFQGDEDEIESMKKLISASKIDGVILMTSRVNDKAIAYLTEINFPFCVIGSPLDEGQTFNHVDNDNITASYELTKHLIQQGKKKISIIAGDKNMIATVHRIKGYEKALIEAKYEIDENLIYIGDFDEKTGYIYAKYLFDNKINPDAILATDDLVAFGVVRYLLENNIEIPNEVAVASFNNSILSRQFQIPITSVDIHADTLGEEAVKILLENIEGGNIKKTIVPHTIHIRKSSANLSSHF